MQPFIRRIFTPRNLLLLALVCLIAVAFSYIGQAQNVTEWLRRVFDELVGYNAWLAGAVFFLLATLSAALSFFTSTPLIPIAIALWGEGVTLALLLGGWMAGAVLAYYIGHTLSHLIARLKLFRKIELYREQLGDTSEFMLMLLFRLGVPSELAAYTLGLIRYNFPRYLLITFIAEVPFAVLAIYSSTALIGSEPYVFAILMAVGLVAVSTFVYFFHRRLKAIRGIQIEE